MNKIKVYVDGKRKFSWCGLVWKYNKKTEMITFRNPVKDKSNVSVTYDVHLKEHI